MSKLAKIKERYLEKFHPKRSKKFRNYVNSLRMELIESLGGEAEWRIPDKEVESFYHFYKSLETENFGGDFYWLDKYLSLRDLHYGRAKRLSCEEMVELYRSYQIYALEQMRTLREDPRLKEEEHHFGCFITSACIEAKGLSDDCFELNTLREFRDSYIKNLSSGEKILSEYYTIAPLIVDAISKDKNSREIYEDLYERLVLQSLYFILDGQKNEAFLNYLKIVNHLKQRYL